VPEHGMPNLSGPICSNITIIIIIIKVKGKAIPVTGREGP
jgi:hypothetical protein